MVFLQRRVIYLSHKSVIHYLGLIMIMSINRYLFSRIYYEHYYCCSIVLIIVYTGPKLQFTKYMLIDCWHSTKEFRVIFDGLCFSYYVSARKNHKNLFKSMLFNLPISVGKFYFLRYIGIGNLIVCLYMINLLIREKIN